VLTVREVRTICREQGAILASISGASDWPGQVREISGPFIDGETAKNFFKG
jgi:hypothetical protein